jgi:hypothetical protein
MFIRGIDQVEKIRRDGQGEFVIGEFGAGVFLGRQRRQQPLQLVERGDPIF